MNLSFESFEARNIKIVETTDYSLIQDLWVMDNEYHDRLSADKNQGAVPTNTPADFARYVENRKKRTHSLFIAVDGASANVAVGYCVVVLSDVSRQGYISALFVREDYRGRKIATSLLHTGMQWLRHHASKDLPIELSVMAGNEGVMKLYKSLGFELTGYTMANFERK
jgi:ribosomal protein S18 acetylase RimI-like enzyme